MADFFCAEKHPVAGGFNPLSINAYQDIHLATLRILENTGVFVEDKQARELFGSCGADIDEKKGMVKLPTAMVEDAIQSAPAQLVLAGRTPEHDRRLDNEGSAYLNFGGGVRVIDPYTGVVRSSTKADLAASARLCDALSEVSVYSRAVYPLDQTQALMHVHTAEACLNHTAKPSFHASEGRWQTEKIIEMAAVSVGGAENLRTRKPIMFASAVSSPLKLTRKFCETIMTASNAGFTTLIASMALAGGTGPVNLAGTLVLTNAEILAGIVLTQLARKGAGVIYGCYSTIMDLRLGATPLGAPETALIAASATGLCRYYQIPCLVPGITSDSKRHGAQATFEKTLTGVAAALSGADLQVGIGGLETGLTFDFGQAVLDNEIVALIRHLRRGFAVNKRTLAEDAIHETGPFGEFLSHDTTLADMKSLSRTHLFDRHNRQDWENSGQPESHAKALSRAREILETHHPEPLPAGAAEQIRGIVEAAEREVKKK